MASFEEGSFVNGRSQKLYYRVWPVVDPKAALVFHHGYGSHCGAYDSEFQKMANAGITLFMYDAHSFGRSEPRDEGHRSLVNQWQDLVQDLLLFRKEIVDKRLGPQKPPIFLAGLSMGGMTAILAALHQQTVWQGLVLLSPAVDCPRNFTLTIMSKIQSILVKIAPRSRLIPQPIIRNITLNEEERATLAKDEYFDPLKVRVKTGAMFLHAWDHIAKNEQQLTLPILIHYSSIDKVVYPAATERLSRRVQSTDITVKAFDKFAHDIFLDVCKDESCLLVIEWILQRAHQQLTSEPAQNQNTAKL